MEEGRDMKMFRVPDSAETSAAGTHRPDRTRGTIEELRYSRQYCMQPRAIMRERCRRTTNCRGSMLIVELIDRSRMTFQRGRREAWSGRVPVESGRLPATVRYHIWFSGVSHAGRRTSMGMSLPFVKQLQIQCGSLSHEW